MDDEETAVVQQVDRQGPAGNLGNWGWFVAANGGVGIRYLGMRTRMGFFVVVALLVAFIVSPNVHAQMLVNIETVRVGDAGNASDMITFDHGAYFGGGVPYEFSIGKYEVTINQYAAFLNSVASVTSDSHIVNLWATGMTHDLNIAGISRSGSGTLASPYSYSVIGSGNRPITYVSWFDAARFCNWLHNGATNGASTETGAYTLNGATSGVNFTKNIGATWWIPSLDEWYKAAWYKGGGTNAGYWRYPTQSDTEPGNTIGGLSNQANYFHGGVYAVTQSPTYSSTQNYLTDAGVFSNSAGAYGTFDQGGNVYELNDAAILLGRGIRGGSWLSTEYYLRGSDQTGFPDASDEGEHWGFRVASVAPTPGVVLTVEKTTSLSGQWRFDREINVGPMTNTNEFYRLKIRTVVE